MDKNKIQNEIDELYKKVVVEDISNCNLGDREFVKSVAKSFGYTEEEINDESNLGLGCGNPVEFANLKPGEIVVDLGCGKGIDVFKASKVVGDTGLSVGVDRLEEMISSATKIAEKRNFKNVKFIHSDITDIKLDDEFCDCVISNCVINLSLNKQRVYDEIYRILKKGGRISISDIVRYNQLPEKFLNDPKYFST